MLRGKGLTVRIRMRTSRVRLLAPLLLVTGLLVSAPLGTAQGAPPAAPATAAAGASTPRFTAPAGFDVSAPMRELAGRAAAKAGGGVKDDPDRGAVPASTAGSAATGPSRTRRPGPRRLRGSPPPR